MEVSDIDLKKMMNNYGQWIYVQNQAIVCCYFNKPDAHAYSLLSCLLVHLLTSDFGSGLDIMTVIEC